MKTPSAVVALATVGLWGCVPAGQTAQAKRAYATAAPVIVAIDHHRHVHGTYPIDLLDLDASDVAAAGADTATTRAAVDRVRNATRQNDGYWHYLPDSGQYRLSVGFPPDHCTYDSRTAQWKCGGVI